MPRTTAEATARVAADRRRSAQLGHLRRQFDHWLGRRDTGQLEALHAALDDAWLTRLLPPGHPRMAHVYFARYDEFGPPCPASDLEMSAPPGPVLIRSIGYQDGQDHLAPGDDRIVIYYEPPPGDVP